MTSRHIAALVALALGLTLTGAAPGQPGDLFELRAGGSLDWTPSGGAILVSSGSKLTESGVLTSPFGSAAFEESAGPGVVRTRLTGSFTNPPLETRLLGPSTFARATTRLTVTGPDGVVNVRVKAQIDVTVLHTCPSSFTCTSAVTVFVGDQNTAVTQPGGASPNLLGLNVDPVPGGYRVHGSYVSALRPVFANSAFDAILSLQLIVGNLGGGAAGSSSFDVYGEVSFSATGTVLEVPSGYTVTAENVEDNHWTDPFAPPPSPDIELRFADGSFIGPADVLDLGNVASGATSPAATFTIANTGAAALGVQPLTAPAGFAIDDQPDGTVAPGATTTAGLTCGSANPGTAPVVLDEVVTVASDDPDEGSLDLRVRCTVLPESPAEPDIELRDAGGTALPLPHLLDLGDVASGSPATAGYLIANVGTGPLTIANITHDAPTGLGSATLPGAGSVQPGGSTTAGVSCGGVNPGEATVNVLFRVRVFSNDADESPADVLVRCRVLPPAPDIELRYEDGTPMSGTPTIDLGDVRNGVFVQRQFQIANVGAGRLVGDFDSVTEVGAVSVPTVDNFALEPGTSGSFTLRCGPNPMAASYVGVIQVRVRFSTNDPAEDDGFTGFYVRCNMLPPPAPDVELRYEDGTPMSGTPTIDLGDVRNGVFVQRQFQIANVGAGRLVGDFDSVTEVGAVSVPTVDNFALEPGTSGSFTLRCGPNPMAASYVGVIQVRVRFSTNDPAEDDGFTGFYVRCNMLPPPAPDIELRYEDGTPMSGTPTIDLGDVRNGVFVQRQFQIANVGAGRLVGDFDSVTEVGAVSVPTVDNFALEPGTSGSFTLRCGPNPMAASYVGVIQVRVRFSTNDPAEDDGFTGFYVRCNMLPPDTAPPTLSLPTSLSVDATGPAGATVDYSASASDLVDPTPTLTCSRVWGSVFPIGTTAVTCTATDDSGNSASGVFTVTVRGAGAQIAALIATTEAFVDSPGIEAALRATLRAAAQALAAGRKPPACAVLAAYILGVRALPSAFLSGAEKTELIAAAARIRTVVGC